MNEKELRVGNYIYNIGDALTIVDSDIIHDIFIQSKVHPRYYPIKLTEEWLDKLPGGLEYPKWIKYVHDLQNWYYYNNQKQEIVFK